MNSYILEFNPKDIGNLNEIRDGLKTVETRAVDERYKNIKPGDSLLFRCGDETLVKVVEAVYHFEDVDSMVAKIPYKKIMPNVASVDEMKMVYSSYPNYNEKIEKFGIFAFVLMA